MDIDVEKRHGNTSSNPRQGSLHFTYANTFGQGIDPTILPQAMGKIVGQPGFFNLAMATGLGEGKLWIQTC